MLGNNVCNSQCNTEWCAYDNGSCLTCAAGCYVSMLGDGVCQDACNVDSCQYDQGDCGRCGLNCTLDLLSNHLCDLPCLLSPLCNSDNGNCAGVTISGCLVTNIANSICDPACNTAENLWDGGDCDCSPGCTQSLLANSHCDPVCSTSACKWDNGNCGYCAPGCMQTMLGNSICDSACNTLQCFFDNGDCTCSPGCLIQDFPSCPQPCLNYKCGFAYFGNAKGCNDAAALKQALSQQAISKNYLAVFNQTACFASDETCTSGELANYSASNECQWCHEDICTYPCDTPECVYTLGNCYSTLHSTCARGFGPGRDQCFECKFGYLLMFSTCVKYCPLGYEVNSVIPQLCTPLKDTSTQSKPAVLYATSAKLEGDGSLKHPFGTLGLAVSALWNNYAVIYVLGPMVDYKVNFTSENPEYATTPNLYDPLSSVRILALTIQSVRCSSLWSVYCSYTRTAIQGFAQMVSFNISCNVTFQDVTFSSVDVFQGYAYTYCPVIIFNQSASVPADLQANSHLCNQFSEYSIITVQASGWLWLNSVRVQNLTMQMLAFINIQGGNVRLNDVNFTSVQATNRETYAAVIVQQSVCSPGHCGSLYYQSGFITLVNNGYEYIEQLFLSPFIRAKSVDYVELTALNFQLNMVVESSVGAYGSTKALIYIGNCNKLNISNSNFVGNIATGGIIFVDSDIDLPSTSTSSYEAQFYSTYRLTFMNLYFSYNYADEGIIYVSFGGFAGSVDVINCEIRHCASVSQSLITVASTGESLTTVANGQVIPTTSAVISRRNSTFSYLLFYKNASYLSLLAITGMGNGQIMNILSQQNGNMNGNTNIYTFSYYVNATSTGTTKVPQLPTPLPCSCSISLQQSAYFLVRNVSFTYNSCQTGGVGLDASNLLGKLNVTQFGGFQNIGSYQGGGTMLTLSGVEADLAGLTIWYNVNSIGSMVVLAALANVTISNSDFNSNSGFSGTCINVLAGNQLTLREVEAENNLATGSNGGVLYWQGRGQEPNASFTVDTCIFQNNTADNGGVFYLTGLAKYALKVYFTLAYFESNTGAVSASAVYIGPMIEIKQTSIMSKVYFVSNVSPVGAVYLMHYKGNFTLIDTIFSKNKGQEAAGMGLETSREAQVYLINVYFGLHTQGPTVLLANPRVFTQVYSHNVIFRNNEKTDIIMEGGYWEDRNSLYNGSTVAEVVLSSSAIFNVSDSVFMLNFDPVGGSAVQVQTNSTFLCVRCSFLNNSAGLNGGALTVEQNSVILLSECIFEGNSAQQNAAALYVMAATERQSVIRNSRFRWNRSGWFGTIFVTAAWIVMENVTFQENYGVESPGIVALMGGFLLTDVTFSSQIGELAAFLVLLTYSNATVRSCSFDHGSSTNGGALYVSASSLSLSKALFSDITGSFSGAIYAVSDSNITLSQVSMTRLSSVTSASLVYLYSSSLTVLDSVFLQFSPIGIYGLSMPWLSITRARFEKGSAGAVYCDLCALVNISTSSFSLLTATSGAAISLQTNAISGLSQAFLANLTCTLNNATTGGAVNALNYDLSVLGGLFERNTADIGGALYFDCDITRNCTYVISETQFSNNTAHTKGGAIAWESAKPTLFSPIFTGNTANYGANIASFPIKLHLDSITLTPTDRLLSTSSFEGVYSDFVSGQEVPFTLTLSLRDHLNQTVTTNSVSSASLESSTGTVAGVTKVMASSGTFAFSAFTIYAKPGYPVSLTFSTDGISEQTPNDPDTHIATEEIMVLLRTCFPGEFEVANGCQLCTKGTFSLSPANSCQNCPTNAECLGQFYLYPTPGYWRSSNSSAVIRPCPNPNSCLGGQLEDGSTDLQGVCASGYKGNLCQSCAENYSRTGPNKCGLCPENDVNIVRLIFVTIAMILLLCIMVWTTLRSSIGPKAIHSILIKILVNYFQLVLIVTQFKLNWPGPVDDLFNSQQEIGGATAQAYSFDCFLQNGSGEHPFFTKMIFMAVLPLPLVLIVGLVWVCIALKHRKMTYMQRECTATIVIVYFLILPDLVQSFFSLLSCSMIEEGEYWLAVDLDIRCWNSTHSLYALALGVPAIVLWVFTVPLLCLLTLVRNRRQQDELWFKLRYGFLTNGYMRKRYYWEFVILYRKISIIMCSVFLSDTITLQALTVELILSFFLLLQHRIKPYTTKQLNYLELLGILVANITIYCGLYFLTNQLSTNSSWFFFTVIVTINAAFIFYWISAIFAYALDKFLSRFYVFRKWFHMRERLDPDIEQLLVQYVGKESYVSFGTDLKWAYRQMAARGRDLFLGTQKLKSSGRPENRVDWRQPPSVLASYLSRMTRP